jgi:hypothetical protein
MRDLNLIAHFKMLGIVASGAIAFVLIGQNATVGILQQPSLAPSYERRVPLEQPRPTSDIRMASASVPRR